ncbi:hypothetical protein [Candidatus Mycobacterium methanotrophicum]|uniref:Uncharacterized protein n=1 Tax=Candidatus Mycobacterium methanotrophicum TaxID=2943498 RepID=A0ABY4QSI9_9MYCO|nr:hypothetical protein [Candidatus Mycobacterium methanotrophicum]UQX13502.1 hypothetical protein M5I08_25240 [Candidatus Mycobacterium methanotrophicum]
MSSIYMQIGVAEALETVVEGVYDQALAGHVLANSSPWPRQIGVRQSRHVIAAG